MMPRRRSTVHSLLALTGAMFVLTCVAMPADAASPEYPCASDFGDCDDKRSAQQDEQDAGPPEWLTIGDHAPKFEVPHWLKGREIDEFDEGEVTVLVFWATWSVPCREIVPLLTELQNRYDRDDVTIAVVSDERPQTLVRFLAEPNWYEAMDFAIATDPKRTAQLAYMEAAAVSSVPSAFLIGRDGHVEWIGHPRDLAAPLNGVVNNSWDRAKAKEKFETEIAASREHFLRMREMKAAYRDEDWPRLIEMFDEAIAADPVNSRLKVQKFQLMVGAMNRPEEGYSYGRELLKEFWSDAYVLNDLAWYVVDYERVHTRDLEFAMTAAKRATELTEKKNAAVLDTVARVYFEGDDLDKALEWQRMAVAALKPGDPSKEAVLHAMERYERKARKRDDGDQSERR